MKIRFIASVLFLAFFACNCHNYNSNPHSSRKADYEVTAMEEVAIRMDGAPSLPSRQEPKMNTEQYDLIVENDFRSAFKYPLSTFGVDVDNASYSNCRRFLMQGSLPPRDAVRIEEFINYFNYDYPQPGSKHPFSINTEVGPCPWNAGHQLIHIGLQGKNIAKENLPSSNLVFLIDVSGSMDAPNKLPLLKNAFKLLVSQLGPEDRVAMVVYAGASGVVLPSTSGAKKRQIRNALDRLQAGGSTAGAEGIQLAYKIAQQNFIKEGNNRVILATDGDFNVGQSNDSELVQIIEKKRDKGIFLSIIGFGTGNYKDSKMEKLADNGNGNYAYIDNINEARKVLVKEITSTLYTIAKDVKLQIEFNPAHVKEYRLIGYENRLLNDEDFNDDRKDSGDMGAGHTVTALYEIVPSDAEEFRSGNVDELKYQDRNVKPEATVNPEMMTIKLRYKHPDSAESQLIEHIVYSEGSLIKSTSDNFRFSAAVSGFGMLLRDSKHKGGATYDNILELAQSSKGEDREGYRNEFVRLMKLAKDLSADDDLSAKY